MSFFGEGNFYLDQSYVTNTTINNSLIINNRITACTIDMLSTTGNFTRIINVQAPILPNDAVIKQYVDALGIIVTTYTLINITPTVISTNLIGSFLITVNSLVNGPCANFSVSKSNPNNCGQVIRTTLGPGTNKIALDIVWPANSGIQLFKTGNYDDGSYICKLI
jgi:hypothetical protein